MKQEKLGRLGEELVQDIFGGYLSEDKYDQDKDLIIDGKNVEVKTQNRFIKKNAFTVWIKNKINQERKCLDVDRLLFVEYNAYDDIKIWESPKLENGRVHTKDENKLYFSISDLDLLTIVNDPALAKEMRDLSGAQKSWLRAT